MAGTLKIFAMLFMLFAAWIIFNAMKVSSLYPFSDMRMFQSQMKHFGVENKLENSPEFKRLEQDFDYLQNKYRNYYRKTADFGVFCLISFLVASILLFISSRMIARSRKEAPEIQD